MRRFLYFIPGHSGASAKTLKLFDLLDRFSAGQSVGGTLIEHCVTAVTDFPKAPGHGCIVCAGSQPPALSDVEGPRWADAGKFFVAVEDLPPRPQDLERELGIAGPEIVLADGQSWRVPLVRRWDPARLEHASSLPRMLKPTFGEGRTSFAPQVKPEFAAIDALADRIFKTFCEGGTIPVDSACDDVLALLRLNYRISAAEAGLIGLLNEEICGQVLAAAIDLASVQAQAVQWCSEGVHAAEPAIEDE